MTRVRVYYGAGGSHWGVREIDLSLAAIPSSSRLPALNSRSVPSTSLKPGSRSFASFNLHLLSTRPPFAWCQPFALFDHEHVNSNG